MRDVVRWKSDLCHSPRDRLVPIFSLRLPLFFFLSLPLFHFSLPPSPLSLLPLFLSISPSPPPLSLSTPSFPFHFSLSLSLSNSFFSPPFFSTYVRRAGVSVRHIPGHQQHVGLLSNEDVARQRRVDELSRVTGDADCEREGRSRHSERTVIGVCCSARSSGELWHVGDFVIVPIFCCFMVARVS